MKVEKYFSRILNCYWPVQLSRHNYEELHGSRRVLSCSADLYNSSYPTQPNSIIAQCLSETEKCQKLAKSLAAYPQMACVLTALFENYSFITEITTIKCNIICFILLHEKFLQFDWLRAVVFQLNLKYLHVKITNLLRVVV